MPEARDTIGEYLAEHDPVLVLWHHLAGLVGQDESIGITAAGLTLPASTIYLVGVFEGEVSQGGFRQFLADPSGDLAAETLQALKEVGAHVSVELLEKAMTAFPGGVAPADRPERSRLLNTLARDSPGYFGTYDELYNQHVDAQSPSPVEKINTLLLDYMKEHAAARVTY